MKLNLKSFLVLFTIFIFVPKSIHSSTPGPTLTLQDLEEERFAYENGDWYIGTPQADGSYLESFSKWLCFPSSQAVLSLVEIEYDGEVKFIPQAEIETDEQVYLFAPDGDTADVGDPVLVAWRKIVENSSDEFCVYAAYLHSVDLDRQVMGEFWIIQKIKSSFGLWEVGDKDKITK